MSKKVSQFRASRAIRELLDSEPIKPVKRNETIEINCGNHTLQSVLDRLKEYNVDYNNCFFDVREVRYGFETYTETLLSAPYEEPEEDFNKRMKKYEEDLKKWKDLLEFHKEDIAIYKEMQAKKVKKEYEKELEKINKKYKNLLRSGDMDDM